MKQTWILALTLLIVAACAKDDTTSDADNTTSSSIASAMAEVSDVAGEGETGGNRFLDEAADALDVVARTSCSGVNFSACASAVRERNFSSPTDGYCTRGSGNSLYVYGKAILTFANTTNCGFGVAPASDATPPSVTRTLSNHYTQVGASGAKLLIYTGEGTVGGKTIAAADLKDFEGNSRSGGAVLKKVTAGKKLTISGIHRRGVTAAGRYTLWHTLYTDADGITVTDGSGVDRILNGTMYVMHNRVQRKITKTLTNVKFTGSCRFPVEGTTSFTSSAGTVTVTWGSCGTATIDGTATELGAETR